MIANTVFCVVGGSRCHNLEIETSDYDFLIFSSDCKEKYARYEFIDDYNVITSSPQRMFNQIYDTPYWAAWQWFFPYEWKSSGEFTNFIKNQQNEFVYKNLQLVKQSYEQKISKIKNSFSAFCLVNRKMVAYSFLFLNLLRDLPQGKEPIRCMRPEGELHEFLINIRKGEYSEEYLRNEFLILEKEKNKHIKFYEKPRDEEFFRMVKNEIEKYNFLPYEDYKLLNS